MLIRVRKRGSGYVAYTDYFSPHFGDSPDAALGWLIRELDLGGCFATPVKLELDIQSDVEYERDGHLTVQ